MSRASVLIQKKNMFSSKQGKDKGRLTINKLNFIKSLLKTFLSKSTVTN